MADRSLPNPEVTVRAAKAAELAVIEPMWLALYRHQKEHGMLLDVSAPSFGDWAKSMSAALGRFSCVFVAELEGELIGFLAGSLKTLPRYFGGFLIGFISEVFVSEACRGRRIGEALVDHAAQWFKTQHVHRIELQVLLDNQAARRLYQRMGWKEELVQMVFQWPKQ